MSDAKATTNQSAKAITNSELVNHALSLRGAFLEQFLDRGKDIDKECGYPEFLTPALLKLLYDREGICKRVVNIFPDECWKQDPEIIETDDTKDTLFEATLNNILKQFQLFSIMQRADKLSGIATFGIMLLGIDDDKQLIEPVDGVPLDGSVPTWLALKPGQKMDMRKKYTRNPKHNLIYTRVFDETAVSINKFEIDIRSPRYGLPLLYNVNFIQYGVNTQIIQPVAPMPTSPTPVHWTRIIHLADNRESSEVYGVPRASSVYNRLIDLRKVLAGSGEMFWKGGFPGISFEVNPELQSTAQLDPEEMREQFERYQQGLQRYLALVGVTAKSLQVQLADPSNHFKTHMQAIGASLGIPYRVLIGTEEAKLAADQDATAWMERVGNRQTKYCTPYIIEPVITRLIYMGILPPLQDMQKGIIVNWEDLHSPSDTEKAEVADTLMDALNKYVTGGCDTVIPPKDFLVMFMNKTEEEADAILGNLKKYLSTSADPNSQRAALNPAAPGTPQPPPPGGVPIPGAKNGEGASVMDKVSNFPNGGDPKDQARAARGGAFGKGGLDQTQAASPMKAPSLKKPQTIQPAAKLKSASAKIPSLNEQAFADGATAKRTGKGPSVPKAWVGNRSQYIQYKAGYRSAAHNRS